MKGRFGRILSNLGITLVSISFILILTEIALRFTSFKNLLPINQLEPLRNYLKADPVKGYDIVENAPPAAAFVDGIKYDIWSNELGCFDTPYRGEKDFLLLVGDSFTFAFAPFKDKWGTKVEDILGRRVLKCGVGGYGTKQEMLKASAIMSKIKLSPRLIIVGYFLNDMEDDYLFPNATILGGYPVKTRKIKDLQTGEILIKGKEELEEDRFYGVKEYPKHLFLKKIKWWVERDSVIYNLSKYSFRPLLLNIPIVKNIMIKTGMITPPTLAFSDRPWLNRAWSGHFSNLMELKQLAVGHGSRLLMVIIPYKEQVYPFLGGWAGVDPERPQRILGEFFRREGFDYIDALPFLKGHADQEPHSLSPDKDLYWRNDPHLNIRGNGLLALLVSEYILENGLVQVDDKERRLASVREQLGKL